MADFREARRHVARHLGIPARRIAGRPDGLAPPRPCGIPQVGGGKGRSHQECRMVDIHGEPDQPGEFAGVGGPNLRPGFDLSICYHESLRGQFDVVDVFLSTEFINPDVLCRFGQEVPDQGRSAGRLRPLLPLKVATFLGKLGTSGPKNDAKTSIVVEVVEEDRATELPLPFPALRTIERGALDYSDLEHWMTHIDQTILQTRRTLQALARSQYPYVRTLEPFDSR